VLKEKVNTHQTSKPPVQLFILYFAVLVFERENTLCENQMTSRGEHERKSERRKNIDRNDRNGEASAKGIIVPVLTCWASAVTITKHVLVKAACARLKLRPVSTYRSSVTN
jgi:hypothetical protein